MWLFATQGGAQEAGQWSSLGSPVGDYSEGMAQGMTYR